MHSQVNNPYNFVIKKNQKVSAATRADEYVGTINCANITEYGGTWGENEYNYYGYKSGKGSITPKIYKNTTITSLFYLNRGFGRGRTIFETEPSVGYVCIKINNTIVFKGNSGSGYDFSSNSDIRDIFYNTGIATYIWVLSNKKAGTRREGKVQLINANGLYEKRRKALGNKRNDIPESAIQEITRLYGDFVESEISKIFDTTDFGYTKITVERPLKDENGQPVLKKGKPQPDTALRDTENVPLKEDIQTYFEREVLPFAPDAWIDEKKSKVGYEIPFTRYFYQYEAPKPSAEIMKEILAIEVELDGALAEVFGA